MAKRKAKSSTVSINFKGIEGKGSRTKPGEYEAEVEEITLEDGEKGKYLKWVFKLGDDSDEGKAYFNTSLTKASLWNLRGLLEAMGEEVPDSEMDLDLEELVGKKLGVVMEEETWEGKKRVKMVDYYSLDDAPEAGKKSKKEKGDDAEKVSKSDVEAMDRDDLEELIKDKELDVDPDSKKMKKDEKLLEAVLEELEEKGLLEEEKKKGKRGKADKKKKLPKDDIEAMDQDELKGVIDEYELDVDLDDFKSLKKMIVAVADAMDEGGYLKD